MYSQKSLVQSIDSKNINNIFMKIKYKKWMGQKTVPIQVLSIVQSYFMFILSMGYKRSRKKPYITKQINYMLHRYWTNDKGGKPVTECWFNHPYTLNSIMPKLFTIVLHINRVCWQRNDTRCVFLTTCELYILSSIID